jgi:hypothetical protein
MKKTGYEQVSVDEIRQKLRDEHNIDEEFLGHTKTTLVAKLLELEADPVEEAVDSILDGAQEDESLDIMVPPEPEAALNMMPHFGSAGWSEYVMRQFEDDELINEAPKCDGCRRVVELLIGPIVKTELSHVTAPSTLNNGTATIAVRVGVHVTHESHPLLGQIVYGEDIADVNKANCDAPYHKHASATAATRAEGRVLRKLLRLNNIQTAEELSQRADDVDADLDWQVDEPISDAQISAIDMVCKRLDVDVMGFICSGKRIYDDIHSVNKTTAQSMLKELNKLQRKKKEAPQGVGSYQPDWRTKNGKDTSVEAGESGASNLPDADGN